MAMRKYLSALPLAAVILACLPAMALAASPPTIVKAPTISGTAQQEKTLTEHNGEWTNSPTSFSYQWQQCDSSGSNCTAISGATKQTYVPVAVDVGHKLRVQEVASNEGGPSAPATSEATAVVVQAGSPGSVSPPPSPSSPGPIVQVKPVVIPNSSFKVIGATLSLASYAITFTESVADPGTFSWVFTFENGKFGVFAAAAKKCKAGSIRLKRRCRPATVLFARGSETVASAGKVTFAVRPTSAGVKALKKAFKRNKGLPVTAFVTFQSSHGGAPYSRVQSLIVKGRR
jgi:hypothetical protein